MQRNFSQIQNATVLSADNRSHASLSAVAKAVIET
jgi:hypothetical protein